MKRFHFGALVLTLAMTFAHAGQTCEQRSPDPKRIMQGFELAQQVKQTLDQSKSELAIIARNGQDLTQYHLRYSHMGLIRKDADGRWMIVHELNQCGTAESALFKQGLANFFLDDPFRYEALVLIPSAELQHKILAKLDSDTIKQLHETHYNMLAFPYSQRYQNSNQWALEVIAAALAQDTVIDTREQAQAWLKIAGYQATTLEIPMMTRLGARLFRANIAFDDHPMGRRMSGHIDTVTVDSVEQFLKKRDPQMQQWLITLPTPTADR